MHLPTSCRTYACGLLAFAALSSTLRADTLTWDSSGLNPNAPVDGAGTWDTSSALWSNGTVDSIWDNAGNNTAVFGSNNGVAGTVTVDTITAGGLIFNAATSGSYLLSGGTLTLGGSTPTITTNANAEISSVITGSAGLVKNGAGVLTLSGINTYTGGTVINEGVVSVSNVANDTTSAGNLGIGAQVTLNGGTLRYTGATSNWHFMQRGGLTIGSSGGTFEAVSSVTIVYDGGFFTQGTGDRTFTLGGSAGALGGPNAFSSVIKDGDGGMTSLVKSGSGSWSLLKANTYTGTTTVNQGGLVVGIDNAIATGNTLVVNSGGTFSVAGGKTQALAVVESAGRITNGSNGTGLLIVGSGNISGVINDGSTSQPRYFSLGKNGAGTLRVTGISNIYSGTTTISGGTLLINNTSGTGLGVGSVSVTNATLGGNGYSALTGTASHTVGSGGIIAAGDSETNGGIGTLTLNGSNSTGTILDMQAGSSFTFDLGAGDANDTVRFYGYAGASDFLRDSGGIVLNFSGALAGTYDLFRFYSNAGTTLADAGFTQATSNFTLGSGLTGYNATWDYSTLGVISLTLTAVPEPSTAVLLGLGGVCAMVLWRRARYRASVR